MDDTQEKKFLAIMVKRAIWRRLSEIAAMRQMESDGRRVSRGDVIEEMLSAQFPPDVAQETAECQP